jgi:hypothetical protein
MPQGAMLRSLLCAAVSLSMSCRQQASPGNERLLGSPPPSPVVARLGTESILASELEAFAAREGIGDRREALTRYLDLRLLAAESLRRGGANAAEVADVARRAAIQRLLEVTVEAVRTQQNLPLSLLEQLRRTRGFTLAHGPLHQVVHAVVRVASDASDPVTQAAMARAQAIRASVLAAQTPRDLAVMRRAVDGVPGVEEVRVEEVRGFDETGATGQPAEIDRRFAAAAAGLARVEDVSEVVRTPFGFHVIVLRERLPGLVADRSVVEQTILREAIVVSRAQELQRMLAALRARANLRFEDQGRAAP